MSIASIETSLGRLDASNGLSCPRVNNSRVFADGIDPRTEDGTIRERFERFGKVKNIIRPKDKQLNKSFCFIQFARDEDAEKCLNSS